MTDYKFIAIDNDYDLGYGNTPEEAVNNYIEGYGYLNIDELKICQVTSIKPMLKVILTGSTQPVGT